MRTGHVVTLPNGRELHMVEILAAEILKANRAAGAGIGQSAQIAARQAGARLSLRQIDGKPVSFDDVSGLRWGKFFRANESISVLNAYALIHDPTPEEQEAALAAAVVTQTETGAQASITVDGRAVVLAELPFERFQAAIATGDKEENALAQLYMGGIDGVRRSIVSIDGEPATWPADWLTAWPFGSKATTILAALWRDLHGLGEDVRPTVVASS